MATKPQMFGRYMLLDKVASGGMAEVWRAKLTGEAGFQRIVAIKKILPHVAEDQEFISMFTDEANITSRLQHANIGQVYEFSKIGDTFYIAMEYISGKDLKTVWSYNRSRKGTLPIELSAFVVARMADGLDYAHRLTDNYGQEAGIVHRDVSPQNVLLSWDGEVKVIDFGIAKAQEKSGRTRPGTLKGKFAYMSPEQIRGLNLDGRADVFALGVVLYEMCTGERGFSADSEFSLLEMVRNVEIKPPTIVNRDIPAELERIIYKALAKDREHRYQTASELSEDLQRYLIMRGKPPNRQDLAKYLRENFTVDFEKERARLESYKEITIEEAEQSQSSAPSPRKASGNTGSQAPVAPPKDEYDDPTSAWDPQESFASTAKTKLQDKAKPPPPAPAPSGIRPPAQARPVVADPTSATPINVPRPVAPQGGPPQKSSGIKLFAIAATLTLAVVFGGLAVWKLVLPAMLAKGSVVINIIGPSEATVRFNNRDPVVARSSLVVDKVPPGSHSVIVEAPGYLTFTQTNIVTTESTPLVNVKATLKRPTGKVLVSSEPSGATITLDGKDTEQKTPATIEVEGETLHEIALALEGYKEKREVGVKVGVGQETALKLKLMPSQIKVRLVTSPPGARALLGDKNLGITPEAVLMVKPGDPYPEVMFTMNKCEPYRTSVTFDDEPAEQTKSFNLKCK